MKMEKNILPFIELEDIASFNYPVYAHMKEKDCITIYETLEEHTNRCKYYFEKIIYVFLTIFLYLLKCPQSLIL